MLREVRQLFGNYWILCQIVRHGKLQCFEAPFSCLRSL